MDNPLVILALLGAALYVSKLWRDDLHAPHERSLPGATRTSWMAVGIAVLGALGLLALETVGEKALGVADKQTKMTWLFAVYSILGASVLEEIVFRGYLVIPGKGQGALWASIVAFSVGFALLHDFLWQWNDAGFVLTLDRKGFFSATIVFAMSLWLYIARFARWNPSRSLLPCFAAHAAKNAGVVLVKATSGYMGGLW